MKEFVKAIIIYMACFILKCEIEIIMSRRVGTIINHLDTKGGANERRNVVNYRSNLYRNGL